MKERFLPRPRDERNQRPRQVLDVSWKCPLTDCPRELTSSCLVDLGPKHCYPADRRRSSSVYSSDFDSPRRIRRIDAEVELIASRVPSGVGCIVQ
jgi:hypothetical protein